MRNLTLLLLVPFIVSAQLVELKTLTYYVSPSGDDSNPGGRTLPMRTLSEAQRRVRTLSLAGSIPKSGVKVELEAGVYNLSEPWILKAQDSGTEDVPMVWHGNGAILRGSVEIPLSAFRSVQDKALGDRLPAKSWAYVKQVDLKKYGITEFGRSASLYKGAPACGELFFRGVAQQIARWPNSGWAVLPKVIDRKGVFEYTEDIPAEWWRPETGVWMHGYWCHDWYDEIMQVTAIDKQKRTITLAAEQSPYGLGNLSEKDESPRRFYVFNCLEELDAPGEWYVDVESCVLYYWLPEDAAKDETVLFSRVAQPLVQLDQCSNVSIDGFKVMNTLGDGISVQGKDNQVRNCLVENVGGCGIRVKGAGNLVRDCRIRNTGRDGVVVDGGVAATLERGDNVVENCHIQNVGHWQRTYAAGVKLRGVGNTIRHNEIEHMPHAGVLYAGNEQLIELNNIHDTCLETADCGALYTTRNWGSQGNVIRYNFIHDLGHAEESKGVYLDDCDSGDTIFGNVFLKVNKAVFIGGGRDNKVLNNVFIECVPSVYLDDRARKVVQSNMGKGNSWDLEAKLESVNYRQSPWKDRYPHLVNIMSDEPLKPLHNEISRNVVVGGAGIDMRETLRELVKTDDNWFMDDAENPGFVNREKLDFTFRQDAAVHERIPSFEAIPYSKIGLVKSGQLVK